MKQRATKEQIEDAVEHLRAAQDVLLDFVVKDSVLLSTEKEKCVMIIFKLSRLSKGLINAYKDRGWEWPQEWSQES